VVALVLGVVVVGLGFGELLLGLVDQRLGLGGDLAGLRGAADV